MIIQKNLAMFSRSEETKHDKAIKVSKLVKQNQLLYCILSKATVF